MRVRQARVTESGEGPFGMAIGTGRHTVVSDEPEANGGRDGGPDPFELVLSGLGACTAMTVRMYADRKRWPLAAVRVFLSLSADRDAEGREAHVFDRTLHLDGPLDAAQRARLLEVADRCPVGRMLARGSTVRTVLAP